MKKQDLFIYNTRKDLSRAAAGIFLELCAKEIQAKGYFTVVLSGGSTPEALFKLLASNHYKTSVPWYKVHLFWGDERCVLPESPESNYRLAYENLISKIDIPEKNIHRIKGELEPAEAAREYEASIKEFFNEMNGPASFDLVFLGLGKDGHTLSLFPTTDALKEKERLVIENYVPKLGTFRVTMTLPLVNRSANIVFLVSGAEKAKALKDLFTESAEYPASFINPEIGRIIWLADLEAARLIYVNP